MPTYYYSTNIPKAEGVILQNQHYWRETDAALRYILRDAAEAAQNMHDMGNDAAERKYLDQVNDACTVIAWRDANDVRVMYDTYRGHVVSSPQPPA